MTTGRKKGIIFGKGIRLFPLPAQEQEDQEKIFDHADMNGAFYQGFAQAILQDPEEAAEVTPLDRIAFSMMAKAKSEYLNGLLDEPITLSYAKSYAREICEDIGIDPDYLTDKDK